MQCKKVFTVSKRWLSPNFRLHLVKMTKDPSLSQDASERKRTMFEEFWTYGSLALSPRIRRLPPWSAWFVPKISFVSTLLLTLLELPENGPEDSWSRSGNTWLWSNDLFGWQYCTWNLLFALFWMEPSFGIFQRSLWGHNLFVFQKLFIIDSKMNFLFLFVSYALSDQIAWNRLGNNSKHKFCNIRLRRIHGFSVCLRP